LLAILSLLELATAARAQGTLEYRFSGQVGSLNPGSGVFPGVSVGSHVEGWFTIDYNTPDTEPNPNVGNYSSAQVGLGGTIGGWGFASRAHPANVARVANGQEGMPGLTDDRVIMQVGAAGNLVDLSLTFYDSMAKAINGDSLPGSAAAFSAFPEVVLYARNANGAFGQYSLDVAITQVPEPSVMALVGVGVALVGAIGHRRRSDKG